MADKKEKSKSENEEILRIARERFKLAEEAEADIRRVALEDLEFRAGRQWPEAVRNDRDREDRPCLTINRIPQFIRQITNDQRQNRPAIKVSPVDDHADPETARILQGIIRHIEYNSNSDVALDTAFEGAVTKGFGYFRIVTDYVDPMSFEQEILIKRIRNSFSVYLDPNSKEPDGSDANWGFIFEDVPKDDFLAENKDSELASMADWGSIGHRIPGWASSTTVRIAEYFYKEFKAVTLVQLNTGETIDESELPEVLPLGVEIKNRRKSQKPVINWCKMNGIEILEETEWLGRWIPIIPVYGDEIDINGERTLEGVIRHAKDSQRMYNYWASSETETIALAPKAPFIIAEGQVAGYEKIWKTANSRSHAYLPYKAVNVAGNMVAPPQRNVYEAPVQAITGARMQASEDLKATTGIYDSALGNRSNENSGIAIQRRNIQSQTSNFHFIDNLTRSIRHTGRILVDLIPKVYDSGRAARILGDDGEQEIIRINEVFTYKGEDKIFDLGKGKYDVAVDTGPSFATKRQEAAASMLDLSKAAPQLMQSAGDLLVKNMDWPGATEIAERLKKTLPPGLADENKDKPPLPPEVQAQMQQMNQMIEKLTEHLNAANDTLKTKSMELESKERIEFAKLEVQLQVEQMKLGAPQAMEAVLQELAHIHTRLELVGINKPIESEINEAGPEQAAPYQEHPQQQQPTGGNPPGNNNMGV